MGPGTELKRLLGRLGIRANEACLCDQRAMLMDEEGASWCRENIDVIVGWLREEAERRKLLFWDKGAKLIVLRAIHNAEKKLRMMDHG